MPPSSKQRSFRFDEPLRQSDLPRISEQLAAVVRIMSDGQWYTIEQLQRALGGMGIEANYTGVSARIRDLRKKPLNYVVERKCIGSGLFAYRKAQ